jgi:hypothetical protein
MLGMIPWFGQDGNLPPTIHQANWEEFLAAFAFNTYRRVLAKGLRCALDNLQNAGCSLVYVDGSYVTSKDMPGDYDACWDISGVDLKKLDPVFFDFSNKRREQKRKYYGELFPANFLACCITGRTYLDFFQIDKHTGDPKGIVALTL